MIPSLRLASQEAYGLPASNQLSDTTRFRCSTQHYAKIVFAVFPQFSPMRLAVRREPFDHAEWLYEVKYDGFRALARIEHGTCQLVSRKTHVYKSFPGL